MGDDSDVDEELDAGEGGKKNFTDQDYEKALLENLDSDGESLASEDEDDEARGRSMPSDSMFADAEEFAHLLEKDEDKEQAMQKQEKWESRHANQDWRQKKRQFKMKNNNNHDGGKKLNSFKGKAKHKKTFNKPQNKKSRRS